MASVEFVEQRRSALERWLQQLAAHPVIGASDVRSGSQRFTIALG